MSWTLRAGAAGLSHSKRHSNNVCAFDRNSVTTAERRVESVRKNWKTQTLLNFST